MRLEQSAVGRLMPRVSASAPASAAIDFAQRLAECQYPIISIELQRIDFGGRGDRAMMSIHEEQAERRMLPSQADRPHQRRFIPLMHEHQVGLIEGEVESRPRLHFARSV